MKLNKVASSHQTASVHSWNIYATVTFCVRTFLALRNFSLIAKNGDWLNGALNQFSNPFSCQVLWLEFLIGRKSCKQTNKLKYSLTRSKRMKVSQFAIKRLSSLSIEMGVLQSLQKWIREKSVRFWNLLDRLFSFYQFFLFFKFLENTPSSLAVVVFSMSVPKSMAWVFLVNKDYPSLAVKMVTYGLSC